MPELAPHFPVSEEHFLLQELPHRINNEFASLIGIVSLAGRTSSNDEVKRTLSRVEQLLHQNAEAHRILQPPDLATSSTRRITLTNCVARSADRDSSGDSSA
jgi:two-component sensor histidine kinase